MRPSFSNLLWKGFQARSRLASLFGSYLGRCWLAAVSYTVPLPGYIMCIAKKGGGAGGNQLTSLCACVRSAHDVHRLHEGLVVQAAAELLQGSAQE